MWQGNVKITFWTSSCSPHLIRLKPIQIELHWSTMASKLLFLSFYFTTSTDRMFSLFTSVYCSNKWPSSSWGGGAGLCGKKRLRELLEYLAQLQWGHCTLPTRSSTKSLKSGKWNFPWIFLTVPLQLPCWWLASEWGRNSPTILKQSNYDRVDVAQNFLVSFLTRSLTSKSCGRGREGWPWWRCLLW